MRTARTLLGVLLAASAPVYAGELIIHGLSIHSSPHYTHEHTTHYQVIDPDTGNIVSRWDEVTTTERTYNNYNVGLGWRTDDNWAVGAYWNSYRKPTVYFGKGFQIGDSNFSVFVGAATGYGVMSGRKVTPMLAFEYKLPINDQYGVRFAATPAIGNQRSVLHTAVYKAF
jgi:hypothetical protein